nr:helix-turn-helix transcriptional regulator [Cognatishimia sp. F0-27]
MTGSRIRERRVARGIRQSDLARQAGISASYLNLIEHNRRRIGGKLLINIASALDVDPVMLSEGVGATLVAALREAAGHSPEIPAEMDRVDEFAGRFPGWAQLLSHMERRVASLERTVEALTDRMTHDPHLATSLHEVLSTVTAIRSSASILAEPGEIEPEWQARFHRNIYEDSQRLAETSRALAAYLEAEGDAESETGSPQEELDAILEAAEHRIPALEVAEGSLDQVCETLGGGASSAARSLLRDWLARYAADARALPIPTMEAAIATCGTDPAGLSAALGEDAARIMRRLAAMPDAVLPEPVGLAVCDASGVLSYRKPLPGFPMPRFGAACPLWPLYRALSRPVMLIADTVEQKGQGDAPHRAIAVALPKGPMPLGREPLFEAVMMVQRDAYATQSRVSDGAASGREILSVGVACRICSKIQCEGRREPSILSGPA